MAAEIFLSKSYGALFGASPTTAFATGAGSSAGTASSASSSSLKTLLRLNKYTLVHLIYTMRALTD
jgi:hypothetical protein